jgi:hypothetical protein
MYAWDFHNDRAGIGRLATDAKKLVIPDDWTTNISLMSYPVGSVYMSLNSTSPATLFGGTWSAIDAGTFLVAAGTGYAAGATGGAAAHAHTGPSHTHTGPSHDHTTGDLALSIAQMPQHGHDGVSLSGYGWMKINGFAEVIAGYDALAVGYDASSAAGAVTQHTGGSAVHNHGNTGAGGTGNTGSGGTGNTSSVSNLPPYYAVYMWRRTA